MDGTPITKKGFTLVEVVIIIAVLGVLTSVGVIGYGRWQYGLAEKTVKSDLLQAQSAMKSSLNFKNRYPATVTELNETFKASKNVSMSLTLAGTNQPKYTNLSASQNGVLFHDTCNELLDDGYGRGVNNGNQNETYITRCNVYNSPEIQVNSAWTSRTFNVPISSSVLPGVVNSINYQDSYRPTRTQVERDFYQEWHDRFQANGGTYPITSFWDPWANQWSGTPKPTMPNPQTGVTVSNDNRYCITATHQVSSDILYHVYEESQPTKGSC